MIKKTQEKLLAESGQEALNGHRVDAVSIF